MMAKYVVIKDFTDFQDDNHVYRTGDKYPRKGKATKKRVEELTTDKNKRKEVLIEAVEQDE